LEEFGLTEFRHRLVNELSGGQLQRVKIAKALISDPSLIILDEPDAGMDHESHEKLIESIKELNKKKGKTIVFISHHLHDLEDADAIFQVKAGVVSTFEGGDEHAAL
jgi:ABC-type multidrug transport system ATPase subunit